MHDPDAIHRIDRHPHDTTYDPVVRQWLGPGRINFKYGYWLATLGAGNGLVQQRLADGQSEKGEDK